MMSGDCSTGSADRGGEGVSWGSDAFIRRRRFWRALGVPDPNKSSVLAGLSKHRAGRAPTQAAWPHQGKCLSASRLITSVRMSPSSWRFVKPTSGVKSARGVLLASSLRRLCCSDSGDRSDTCVSDTSIQVKCSISARGDKSEIGVAPAKSQLRPLIPGKEVKSDTFVFSM